MPTVKRNVPARRGPGEDAVVLQRDADGKRAVRERERVRSDTSVGTKRL